MDILQLTPNKGRNDIYSQIYIIGRYFPWQKALMQLAIVSYFYKNDVKTVYLNVPIDF